MAERIMVTMRTVNALVISLLLLHVFSQTSAAQSQDEILRMLQKEVAELKRQRQQDRQEIDQLKSKLEQTEASVEKTNKQVERLPVEPVSVLPPPPPAAGEDLLAKDNFVISGFTHLLYHKATKGNGSFELGSFNPIFLFRSGDDLLFEGELEMQLNTDDDGTTSTETSIEFAQMDYMINDNLTLIGGKFLVPLGNFIEKSDPAWINKLPTFPVPRQDEFAILPEGDIGVQLRGAAHVTGEDPVLSYAAFLVNGPGSELSETDNGPTEETLSFEPASDLNHFPAGGGRVAFMYPWSDQHDVEVGVSAETGKWDRDSELEWTAAVGDALLHLGPYFEARGEIIGTWQRTHDAGTIDDTGWWAQAAYKLAALDLEWPIINDLELVYRYSHIRSGSPAASTGQSAIGFVYYITNTFQFKGDYEFINSDLPDEPDGIVNGQLAYGF